MKNFYKKKKVLITGNTGFKGSWLTFILNELGAEIIGYSNSILSNPNMFQMLNLKKFQDLNLRLTACIQAQTYLNLKNMT